MNIQSSVSYARHASVNLHIDSMNSGSYTVSAAAKSVVGIATPEFTRAHDRAYAVFLCVMHSYTKIMVGRAGQPKGWPGSLVTGCCNPVRLTTNEIATSRGESLKLTREAAIMATIPAIDQPEITVINGCAVTTSLAIAEHFNKPHKDVLSKISRLDCSPEFNERNFSPVEYTDAKGERRPAYQVTRDGFAFLAMGFTGKRAAKFKEAYTTAFNQMEQAITKKIDTSSLAQNAHVAYRYMPEIHRVWMAQLYPMLVASHSPIAHSLYDYINDGFFVSGLVDRALSGKRQEGAV